MKIVQSYWSLPSTSNEEKDADGRSKGGWLTEKYHALSWALSCVKFKEFYPNITLYTDHEGTRWLIDKLQLPYKDVKKELDVLNDYNPLLWALPKVYVYGKQEEPFVHADGDVFIWEKFSDELLNNDIIAQNLEIEHGYYNEIIAQIEKEFEYIPECLLNSYSTDKKLISINAGILGGKCISFYKEYSALAFKFIDENRNTLGNINVGMFNSVFEQLLLFTFANSKNLNFKTAFEDSGPSFEKVVHLNTVPLMNKFIHTIGGSKQNPLMCLEMEARLKYEYPKLYRHIQSVYKETKRFSLSFITRDRKPVVLSQEMSLTIKMIKTANPEFNGNSIKVQEYVENEILSKDEITPHLQTIADIFHLESAYSYLKQSNQGKTAEQFYLSVVEALPVLYDNTPESFLNQEFILDSASRQIIYSSRTFNEPITKEVIEANCPSQISEEQKETRIILMESYCGDIVYSYLEGWDLLLCYFENISLSGKQLIELIQNKETPFEANSEDVKNSVINFLMTHAFLYRRLKPVKIIEQLLIPAKSFSNQS